MRAQLMFVPIAIVVAACSGGGCGKSAPDSQVKYTCPMHPEYVVDKMSNCPVCGMKLVPVETAAPAGDAAMPEAGGHDHAGFPAGITIDAERRRSIGLTTVKVRRGEIGAPIRAAGRIARDERRIVKVQPRFEGFIEKLNANFTGKFVQKGQLLASVYSPELLATQNELLLALKARGALAESGLPDAAGAARTRLRLLGMSPAQIDLVIKRGAPLQTIGITAPSSGYITEKSAVAGARFGPDAALFEIVDLSMVWVIADVYEYELPRLAIGQPAVVTLPYWPGRSWRGRAGYIYPNVDERSRTVKVRIAVPNPRAELKIDMFADVTLEAKARSALLVPDDSVIDSGTRKVVFVSLGEGRLAPREVVAGEASGGWREVKSGLREGEEVAAGASFLVDSESRLRSALQSMTSGHEGHAK